MNRSTQCDRLLRLLRRKWATQWECVRASGLRYGARLHDLRRRGVKIEARHKGARWEYRVARGAP